MNRGQDKISHTDIVRSMLGLLCLGKSDYEAVSAMRDDTYFKQSLGISNVPSVERLRQRLDENADALLPIIKDCSIVMLKNGKAPVTGLDTWHIPLDAVVFPMDNSNTKKEGMSRTYHGKDGYAPIAAYLGLEGWCLEVELRPAGEHRPPPQAALQPSLSGIRGFCPGVFPAFRRGIGKAGRCWNIKQKETCAFFPFFWKFFCQIVKVMYRIFTSKTQNKPLRAAHY